MGITYLLEGRPAEAKELVARSANEIFRLAGAALSENALGNTDEAQRLLEQVIARYGHNAAFQIAQIYAQFGDKERAFEWLERARVQRDGGLVLVKVDTLLRGLRGDPRFAALLTSINLPP
jgi:serine/threonine-protein kinase